MSRQTQRLLISLGVIGLVVIVFSQTAQFDWVRYDDNDYVYRCGQITSGLRGANIIWAFTHFYAHNWHPLTALSLMLDCQLFGVNPHAIHVVNVVIHGLAAVALFFALDSLTNRIWRSAFVAAVFAIHPLRVESVAWIAERKDVLSGLFFMLTLLAWSGYARKKWAAYFLLAIIAAALGLLSKPMLVTIPFVLLLVDYWPLQRFNEKKLSHLLVEKIPFLALAAGSVIGTLLAQGGTVGSMGFPLPLRMQNAVVSCVIYLRQLFWPVDLAVLYPHPEQFYPVSVLVSCALLLLVISSGAVLYRKRLPYVFVGWFWFLGMLAPVIGIVQVGRQGHADRYTYLPLIGISLAFTWLIAELLVHRRSARVIAVITSGCALLALAACARRQTETWRNAETLWSHTLAVTRENDGAHLAFATALFSEGKTEEALAHMREAARIRPTNVGIFGEAPLATDEKQLNANILLWSARVEENPSDVNAHINLGVLLAQKHQAAAAIGEWEKALALAPADGNAQSNLAWVLATAPDESLRNGKRAVELATKAMELAGGANPIVARTLAAAYAEAGRFDEAVKTAEQGRALASREGSRALAAELGSNVDRYKRHLPLRDLSLLPRDD